MLIVIEQSICIYRFFFSNMSFPTRNRFELFFFTFEEEIRRELLFLATFLKTCTTERSLLWCLAPEFSKRLFPSTQHNRTRQSFHLKIVQSIKTIKLEKENKQISPSLHPSFSELTPYRAAFGHIVLKQLKRLS